ncbi:hypothetical protein P692DRAFT_20432196 [Suillus brevipes Sb2]|nr:hypothetical protein P692DRAFT_20432196 [Suillus brevipes Sb2]
MSVLPMNHPAHSSSHHSSHAAAYYPLCPLSCFALHLPLFLFFNSLHTSYLHSCILYLQNYPRWRLSAFIPRLFSAGIVHLSIYIFPAAISICQQAS